MKNSRAISFFIIALVYILSSVIGILVYNNLNFDIWLNLLIADIAATVVVFVFSLIFNNASTYDPYWSVAPIVIVGYLFFNHEFNLVTFLPTIAIVIWGIRLTLNWAYTFENLNHQDWRYTMLKQKTGILYFFVNLFGIHLFPTIVVYLCILPVVYLYNSEATLNIFTIIMFIVSICSFTIQGIADYQMHAFRRNKNSVFIRNGLWKYSRHPNYLGEIMMWWSIGLLCVFSLNNVVFLIGAIVNHLMFIFISIPLAENHQKSRKEGFDEYKKETRMLLLFKK